MSTRLAHVVVDANDPSGLARFWSAALQWPIVIDDPHEVEIGSGSPSDVPMIFVPSSEPKVSKNRIHIDLTTASSEEQAATVERVVSLGASPIDIGQRDVPWNVMADPEGNEFCVAGTPDFGQGTGAIGAFAFDAADPAAQGRFWSAATGWTIVAEGDWGVGLRSPNGSGPFLTMGPPVAPKAGKNRLHFDVRPETGSDTGAEAERLIELGATRIDIGQSDVAWVVLADPEGNEFCVLTPRD